MVDSSRSTGRRQTTADLVAAQIREGIWAGEFAPGSRLPEVSLSERFGVGRSTIRETLRVLAGERIVSLQPNSGATVVTLDSSDIHDLYAFRKLLELDALRGSPAEPAAVAALGEAVERMERALPPGNRRHFIDCDYEFHAAIVGLKGSERLNRAFADLGGEMRLALGVLTFQDELAGADGYAIETDEEVVADHRLIYERIAAGHETQHLLEAHLDRAEARLCAVADARGVAR